MSENQLTEEKFLQGMTTQQYIDQIKVNKQPFEDIYGAAEVPSRVQDAFDGLAEPLRLAVFTADWCGDAMSTTPVILRLADSTSKLSHQVFNRDEELDLTNSFLAEDRAGTVPVFVVMDSNMNEIARFVETANELVPSIDAMDETIAQEVAAQPPMKQGPLVGPAAPRFEYPGRGSGAKLSWTLLRRWSPRGWPCPKTSDRPSAAPSGPTNPRSGGPGPALHPVNAVDRVRR